MSDRIISRPSKKYTENYAAIFGDQPRKLSTRARTYKVYDPVRRKWVNAEDRPQRPRGVAQWPMWSDAFGVHPDQAADEYKRSVELGVPTEFCPKTGRAKFESPRHRKRAVEALSYGTIGDLDGGYSDPQIHEKFHGDLDE
jgi:hypothetical protein